MIAEILSGILAFGLLMLFFKEPVRKMLPLAIPFLIVWVLTLRYLIP